MIFVVELDTSTVDGADGFARARCRNRELFQELSPNLNICVFLLLRLVCPRPCGFHCRGPTTGAAWNRPIMCLRYLDWIRGARPQVASGSEQVLGLRLVH